MHQPASPRQPACTRRTRLTAAVLALAGLIALTALAAAPADAAKRKRNRGVAVRVMTRNLFLGSSLAAGLEAANLDPELCDGAGQILREVDATKPYVRMHAVANEILRARPDLVGLQEAVAYYTQTPPDGGPLEFGTNATTVKYDFIRMILKRLNRGRRRYRLVRSQNEFEFEVKANYASGLSGCANADIDGRMKMRDAILARVRAGVRTRRPRSSNYRHLLSLDLAGGFPYPILRGWESVNVRVRGSRWFRLLNTHLEAFDNSSGETMYDSATMGTTTVGRGSIRKAQAQELVRGPGRAGRLPVILIGDLNSNVPGLHPGDQQAFRAVLAAGFKNRSTYRPRSCCSDVSTGPLSDFDHVVDHVVTNRQYVRLIRSWVVGRRKVAGGVRPSDHAGVISVLRMPR